MVHIKKILFILPFVITLMSCSEHGDYCFETNGDLTSLNSPTGQESEEESLKYFINVTSDEFIDVLKVKGDRFLLISEKGCSSCATFRPICNNYIYNTKKLIYQISYTYSEYAKLNKAYSNIFSTTITFPSLYMLHNDTLIRTSDWSKMTQYNSFVNHMNAYTKSNNLFTFSNYEKCNNFLKEKNCLVYINDSKNVIGVSSYNDYVYESVINKSTSFIFINMDILDAAERELFAEHFSLFTDSPSYMFYLENNDIKASLNDYSKALIESFLNTYA